MRVRLRVLASSMVYATIRPMHGPLRVILTVTFVVSVAVLNVTAFPGSSARAQDASVAETWLDIVNETRLSEGLDPYGQSRLLAQAAQRHADDLAQHGFSDPEDVHLGSDGSDVEERIDEAGYAAWTRDGDQLVVAENVSMGEVSPQDALAAFLDDETARENLLSNLYREIGVGAVTDAAGQRIDVLTFGARPNVLPIFVNDGAASTENREVAVRLTNERVRPDGQGTTFIGEAIEIRMSNEPSFEQLPWEPWAQLVSWTLPDDGGEHTVYVQFRDAGGRTAASADGIFLDQGTPPAPTTPPPSPTPSAASDSSDQTSAATAESPEPDDTAAPGADETPSGDSSPGTPVPGEDASPSPDAASSGRPTPFPTWTPLPSPEPTPVYSGGAAEPALALPNLEGYEKPLTIVGVLQGVAVVLGLFWLVRRGRAG